MQKRPAFIVLLICLMGTLIMTKKLRRKMVIPLGLLAVLGWVDSDALAHDPAGPRGLVELDWSLSHISRILSAGYGDTFGIEVIPNQGFPTFSEMDGRRCARGSLFAFDVDDDFAFDIDEKVEIELVFDGTHPNSFVFLYDRNALAEPIEKFELPPSSEGRWSRQVVRAERARFANRGMGKTDFIIVAKGAISPVKLDETHTITICDVTIQRSHQTKEIGQTGWVNILAHDASTQQPTSVRLGIYDATGRMPLPSDDAVPIKYYGEEVRQIFLRTSYKAREPWPVDNRYVFYMDGHYRAELPVGPYELVATKGPEYHMVRQQFTVGTDAELDLHLAMKRWDDMPDKGWYSGDGHIHVTREVWDNQRVSAYLRAEDIHVSNLLQMGNPTSTYFHQYGFGESGRYLQGDYALVPGVEDPRTAHRGHTYSVNIEKPIRDRESYFLYHRVFEAYARQGGMSGYAHVGSGWFNENRGMALDVPLGVVDFVEIMQDGSLYLEEWYDFLNLGYRLLPVAGSDFPYIDQPGAVRSYVKLDGEFSTPAWFDALREGYTFVTNGPLLELTVNGQPMGSTLALEPGQSLSVRASARINPDIDRLDRLEMVVHGEVVESATTEEGSLSLDASHEMKAHRSLWIAARAYGRNQAISHTAPVYVTLGDQGTWCAEKAPGIVEKMRRELETLRNDLIKVHRELEPWDAGPGLEELWLAQKPEIDKRIEEALSRYDELLKEIRTSTGGGAH